MIVEALAQTDVEPDVKADNAQPGDTMEDGTIFAGISPNTGQENVHDTGGLRGAPRTI